MKYVNLLLAISITSTTIFGDYVVFKSKFSKYGFFRAITDSIVHALIGFLSSLAFFNIEINIAIQAILCNVAICTIISSFIDVDHVFVAKSLLFEDITNTKQRGIFHCTTFCLVITIIMFMYSYLYKKINIYTLTWMFVVAYTSHHVRDGNRRGLWLFPFGHTPPINTYVYMFLCTTLPYAFAVLYKYLKPAFYKYTTVDYMVV